LKVAGKTTVMKEGVEGSEGDENSREEGKGPFPTLEEKFLRMAEKCWLRSPSPHFAAAAYR
jgi:hypothetical protein